MAGLTHVYAGAAATLGGTLGGVFRQAVGSDHWERLGEGLAEGSEVHAVTVHPEDPDTVYIGTTTGAYRSRNRGDRWEKMRLPGHPDIWALLVHPKNPKRLYAGASPIAVY